MSFDGYAIKAEQRFEPATPEERYRIPIRECGEGLKSITKLCPNVIVEVKSAARLEFIGSHTLFARIGVCERLNALAEALRPDWKVKVFDAYRPLAYQEKRFKETKERLAAEHPELTGVKLLEATDRWVALPSHDPSQPPPHSTGGAIDMMIVERKGGEPDYGSSPGNYSSDQVDHHYTNSLTVPAEARTARLRLLRAAIAVGFANHPAEWWHYSYGDQEWCIYTGRSHWAIYGRTGRSGAR